MNQCLVTNLRWFVCSHSNAINCCYNAVKKCLFLPLRLKFDFQSHLWKRCRLVLSIFCSELKNVQNVSCLRVILQVTYFPQRDDSVVISTYFIRISH